MSSVSEPSPSTAPAERAISIEPPEVSKKLIVLLPALNEAATIGQVIGRIPRSVLGISAVEIVVIDDGSTDETARLAKEAGATVVRHPINLGVGAAFHTGITTALEHGADIIVNMDADGQFSPEDIPRLVEPLLQDDYGFVTCSRFADPDHLPKMPGIKLWGNRMMCRLINTITGGPKFTDVSCGFRAYSRDTALRLNLFGAFTYTQETFIDLAAKRIAMTEVSLVVRGEREHGKSRVASNLWRYGFRSLTIILRALRDWRPLLFFGSIAVFFLALGLAGIGFVGCYWLVNGRTSPWTSLITVGGVCLVIGVLSLVQSLLADQIGRSRKIQEELTFLMRRQSFIAGKQGNGQ